MLVKKRVVPGISILMIFSLREELDDVLLGSENTRRKNKIAKAPKAEARSAQRDPPDISALTKINPETEPPSKSMAICKGTS
jgi:hypothetical protein